MIWNALNLVNDTYSVASSYPLAIVNGTKEYAWPSYFSSIEAITDGNGVNLEKIGINKLKENDTWATSNTSYYLRGQYIGFSPTPTSNATYTVYYKTYATELTSYTDTVVIPNNNFWLLINFMLFKAMPKLNRQSESQLYYQLFSDGLDMMKVTSHRQDGGTDSWSIEREQLA